MPLTGYDIAGVNGSGIITTALKGAFTIVKASEGQSYTDDLHDTFVSKLRAAGKLVGHYHYARQDTKGESDAIREADHFIATAKARTGETMWLDFERIEAIEHRDAWPEWALAFCGRVKARTGASCGIYLNNWFAAQLLDYATSAQAAAIRALPLWKAAWPADPSTGPGDLHGWSVLTCWQWKGTGIDEDIFYGDASTWKALAVGAPIQENDVTVDELLNADKIPSAGIFPDNPTVQVKSALSYIMEWSLVARNAAQKAARDSAAALELVKTLAAAPTNQLTEAEIEAAAERGAQKAIDAEITGATVSLNVTGPTL